MTFQPGVKTESGYLATPAQDDGSGAPGVLVLHAWWGLNGFFTELCDRLAREGFVALAPDLYGGAVASSLNEAAALREQIDFTVAEETARAALDTLRDLPVVRRRANHTGAGGIAVLGCSLGAAWAVQLSAERPEDVAAAVLFYGLGEADFTVARAAYLGHFAENDAWDPVDAARALEAQIRAAGRTVTFHVYPGVGHWFFEEDRPDAYNAEAARLAWERTLAFLRAQLST